MIWGEKKWQKAKGGERVLTLPFPIEAAGLG